MPPKKAFQRQYGRKHGLEPSLTRLVREASSGGQPVSFRTVWMVLLGINARRASAPYRPAASIFGAS
jgi:hypothetical protein